LQVDLAADRAMLSALRRGARRTPWMPLVSALLELAGGKAELLRHSERGWASVTFTGSRHDVTLSFAGIEAVAAGEKFIAALPDHEFAIPRQLVADAAVLSVEHTMLPEPRLVVEAQLLLLEDA
jgi:hypothetical protein